MNILICSVGRRVKLIEYFKNELNARFGKVVAVDCDPTAPALYHADCFEIVPRINHPDYIENLKRLCHQYKISAVLSLIDPELSLLASKKEEFEKEGIKVILSGQEVVDICFDKHLTFEFLQKNNLPTVPTYINLEQVIQDITSGKLKFPLIAKPRYGSASIGITIVNTMKELILIEELDEEMIVQPCIMGEEYGCDVYIDLVSKLTTQIFMKRKIRMRAGETDKSIAVKDSDLKKVIENLIAVLKPEGPIDIDCFKTDSGYMISEINPRFGGGYLHAHEMGQNFVVNIINNLDGVSNEQNIGNYQEGSTLVKYDHFIVL